MLLRKEGNSEKKKRVFLHEQNVFRFHSKMNIVVLFLWVRLNLN